MEKIEFSRKGKLEHVKKFVTNLKLRTDNENNVYYLDVVLKVLINTMGTQVDRDNPDNALILRTEKKTQEEINEIIDGYMKRDKKEKNKKNIVITFNPLTTHLYFKMTYQYIKAFIGNYKENMKNLSQYNEEMDKDSIEGEENDGDEINIESERALNKEKQN